MSDYTLRRATADDAQALMTLRIEAEHWLADAGIDQWRSPGFRDRALDKWRKDISEGRTWVVEDRAAAVVATVTLTPADRDFWHAADEPESAVYVAKLITARSVSGEGLGERILDWVGEVASQRGLRWVRLDCWRSNIALQRYYLKNGFSHVRTEAPAHRLSGWMAERDASVRIHPDQPLGVASE
ncbi:GNAT family N-acetyltransferase [Streptomyces sp. TP-A0874]|uniref:GNAT family N-acetyltransferase n=1 Tax=Streptomyces sp. TP-A0874 TaxID=549819 RepID=UPI001FCDA8BC|nr:GNAT family N-acetyltransferase [Streptomyces sp. TP-A0874]